jgi:hypothetical protein
VTIPKQFRVSTMADFFFLAFSFFLLFLKSAKDWAVKLGRKRLNLADKKTANSVS